MIEWKDEDYIHYFYKITNLINGKYYYGIHSLPKSENKDPLNDGYWGSGTDITKDIKKLGKKNFKKEIIKTFSTRQEVSNMEKSIVTMEEVNKSECYNKIPGGDTYEESMLGKVVCRPKNNIEKVVILIREDYYDNKDKYILVGHKKYFLNGSKISKDARKRKKINYVKTQKKDESDTFFSRVRYFVNKDTLKVEKFIGHDEPNDLYNTWFPEYFLDKVNNKFITQEYFKELYNKFHNLEKIAKYLNRNRSKIKDYYTSKGLDLSSETKGRRGYVITSGFSGKCIVHNDSEQLVIDKKDLDKYMTKGYSRGKLKIISKIDIIDYYTDGNNIRSCAKKFSTNISKIKEILGIDNSFEIRIYHKETNRIRLFVNKEYHEKLLANGWIPGLK